jgi:hypothetical protein
MANILFIPSIKDDFYDTDFHKTQGYLMTLAQILFVKFCLLRSRILVSKGRNSLTSYVKNGCYWVDFEDT